MDTPLAILKATCMSFVIFWTILLTEERFIIDILPYMFLSVIPIALCCMLTICLTIAPFFWSKNENTSLKKVYNTYFPFYAIALFGICTYMLTTSNFKIFPVAFISSAFFTLLKSWHWLAQIPKTKTHEIPKETH